MKQGQIARPHNRRAVAGVRRRRRDCPVLDHQRRSCQRRDHQDRQLRNLFDEIAASAKATLLPRARASPSPPLGRHPSRPAGHSAKSSTNGFGEWEQRRPTAIPTRRRMNGRRENSDSPPFVSTDGTLSADKLIRPTTRSNLHARTKTGPEKIRVLAVVAKLHVIEQAANRRPLKPKWEQPQRLLDLPPVPPPAASSWSSELLYHHEPSQQHPLCGSTTTGRNAATNSPTKTCTANIRSHFDLPWQT